MSGELNYRNAVAEISACRRGLDDLGREQAREIEALEALSAEKDRAIAQLREIIAALRQQVASKTEANAILKDILARALPGMVIP